LPKIRKQIEAMGFTTRSVADTVAQINSLFGTARLILALLGMVALAVAALGMFNTLTVSLLERTREVGLMKAMGMKSSEVQELFLTESMIMGFVGGIAGIIIGFAAGKLVGLILSVFSLIRGVGFVDISYLPFPFLITIIFLSLLVGIATGIYPAHRATKISALNALRYE
jgi:putative ABC transport system permease protein